MIPRNTAILLCFLLLSFSLRGENKTDSLIQVLDQTIKERKAFFKNKEDNLQSIKELLNYASTDEQRFMICRQLFDGYSPFSNDSALKYANRKMELAVRLNDSLLVYETQMNIVNVMITAGMYKETMEKLDKIPVELLDIGLKQQYYHLRRKLYGLMADYSITPDSHLKYTVITDLYRDSILMVQPPSSSTYTIVKADQLITRGQYDEAVELLLAYLHELDPNSHPVALFAYSLGEAYTYLKDTEKSKYYYTLSSIADLNIGIKEYVSLRRLAILLFEEGDVERAYNYLTCSLEDAIECNARIRTIEVSQIYPIINEAYLLNASNRQKQLRVFLIAISLLSFFLLLAVFFVYRQMKKVAVARRAVGNANKQLKELNKDLSESNLQLKELNRTLSETSHIKEEYIGRYMDLCSAYIEKLDLYRRSLARIATTGKVEELYKTIKSTRFLEEELKEFYSNFDDTFLQLFPTFVDDFNALLSEKTQPKPGERLNTEMRIFALIRLGINDSNKIAHFLRYSVTTIYNYRTRIRNKALGERDDFENKVMLIGRIAED